MRTPKVYQSNTRGETRAPAPAAAPLLELLAAALLLGLALFAPCSASAAPASNLADRAAVPAAGVTRGGA